MGRQIAEGEFAFDQADEDVHSAIERGVTDRLGDVGARLHAGRSRNDLVVTDLRLWMLAAGRRIEGLITMLVRTLVARAREHAETVMPGTTHARAAQPVTLGHHLLAHAWALLRDLERFDEAAVRTSVSPLGAAALATSTLGLDPAQAANRPRVPARVRQLDRRGVGPRLRPGVPGRRRDLRHPSLPSGRRSRPLDGSGARMGGARRGLHDRVEHHAAEAEPGHRGARAGEGGPDRRGLRRR